MSAGRNRNADEVFCRHCGERIATSAEVCPHCGVRNDRYEGGSNTGSGDLATGDTGLEPNVAGALAYALTFVSGIVLYAIEDDDFVRFHAAQSIAVFGGLTVANALLWIFLLIGFGSIGSSLGGLISLVGLGLWIFLIVTAYRGETRRIPIAADIADRLVSGSNGTTRTPSSDGPNRGSTNEDDALAELRSRYARGEIGDAEFERRVERLLETDDGRPRERESAETERSW